MNYRHAFHAGNFADVHKHMVLLGLIARLERKPAPLFYLDTHAGRGIYDLRSADAARGGEWQSGLGRMLAARARSEDLARYLAALEAGGTTRGEPPRHYPGSPLLALNSLRKDDRAVLVERLPEEARALGAATRGHRGMSIVCGDGYAALKTYLPPRENRGLVLIDPPYEAADELVTARQALSTALARWPNGVFALWYPIKAGPESHRLHAALKESGLRKLLALELTVRPADSPAGLNGSGLIVANPPWQFDGEIAAAQREAQELLSMEGGGSRVEWLAAE